MQGHTVPQTPRLRIGWNVPGTMARLGLHMGMILAWCRYFPTHLPDLVVATSAGAILMSCCITFDRAVLRRVRRVVKNLKRGQVYVMSKGLVNTDFPPRA